MTTFTGTIYSYPRAGVTNADFQTILTKWKEALDSAGLIQTADTGQLDPATATYPASANVEAGYWIYRFNDSLQGADPIFLRFGLGRGSYHGGTIYYRLTVGQGSNGSGTLTGQTIGPINLQHGTTNSSGNTTAFERACHTEGYAGHWYFWEHNLARSPCLGFWTVARMRDQVTGAFNGKGVVIAYMPESGSNVNGRTYWATVRFASPAGNYGANRSGCIMPGAPSSTALANGDKQLYPHWYNVPDTEQAWATFTVRNTEFGQPALTFVASPMYNEARTFLHPGHNPISSTYTFAANSVDSTTWGPCFLWE
jgi:hypothetical protein